MIQNLKRNQNLKNYAYQFSINMLIVIVLVSFGVLKTIFFIFFIRFLNSYPL